jgi:PAS domain S-box-containing protein
LNKTEHITHSGYLSVQRQVSGFFYHRLRVPAAAVFCALWCSCAWAQASDFDKILLPEEKEWLQHHAQWRVGVDPSWPPVEMIGDDGVYVGMGADYLKLLAQRLGIKTTVLPGLSWPQVIDKAKNGEVDVLPAMAHTFERSAYLNFSNVYLDIPLVIITRMDKRNIDRIDDLSGKVVSVVEGYPVNDWLLKDRPQIILHPYRNVSYALDAVAFGQADAYIGDIASASYIIERLSITSLRVVGATRYSFAERIGVRKDWPELVPILNKALMTITRKERDDIQSRWIRFMYKPTFWQSLKEVIPFIIGIAVLVLMGANVLLRREIQSRKKSEEALREAEARFRVLFENSPDGIVILDPETARLIEFNDTACRQLGYSREEFLRLNISDIEDIETPEDTRARISRVMREGRNDFETRHRTRQGEIRNVYVTAQLTKVAGRSVYHCVWRDITERKRGEEALRESERRLSEAQKMAQLGYWKWDVKTGRVEWSEEVFRIFHLDPKTFSPTIESILAYSPWPEDHERDKELLTRAVESREQGSYEQRFLRPDKSIGYYYSTFQGHYDNRGALVSIVGTVMDITARKKIEAALVESREYLDALINTISDPIFVVDRQHRYVLINDASCAIGGTTREAAIGKTAYDFFPKEQADVFLQHDEEVFKTGRPSMKEETVTLHGGQKCVILTRKSLYEDKIGKKYVVGIGRDITYLKDVQQKERLAQLGRLAADMAHEVSNPLMIISGNAQLLLMEDIGRGKAKDNLDIIMRESQRAKDIIHRLLKFSRPGMGELQEADINKIIEAASAIVERQFSLSNITVNRTLSPGLPAVKVDEQQMREVFMHLLNNARDAMPGGGTIDIRTGGDRNNVTIDVQDHGCGMSEDVRGRLFEPFFTTKENGAGLGLPISYSIIRAHHGELRVESQVGKGTVISIILPGSRYER